MGSRQSAVGGSGVTVLSPSRQSESPVGVVSRSRRSESVSRGRRRHSSRPDVGSTHRASAATRVPDTVAWPTATVDSAPARLATRRLATADCRLSTIPDCRLGSATPTAQTRTADSRLPTRTARLARLASTGDSDCADSRLPTETADCDSRLPDCRLSTAPVHFRAVEQPDLGRTPTVKGRTAGTR